MDKKISIYISNIPKENEEKVSAWFSAPITQEMISEKLSLNGRSESCIIEDYDAPFDLSSIVFRDYFNYQDFNHYAFLIENIPDTVSKNSKEIISTLFDGNVDEFLKQYADLLILKDVSTPKELGLSFVDEMGVDVETLRTYFDYDSYGQDILIESESVMTGGCYFSK